MSRLEEVAVLSEEAGEVMSVDTDGEVVCDTDGNCQLGAIDGLKRVFSVALV